jgi:hypothetical protein
MVAVDENAGKGALELRRLRNRVAKSLDKKRKYEYIPSLDETAFSANMAYSAVGGEWVEGTEVSVGPDGVEFEFECWKAIDPGEDDVRMATLRFESYRARVMIERRNQIRHDMLQFNGASESEKVKLGQAFHRDRADFMVELRDIDRIFQEYRRNLKGEVIEYV